MTQIIEIDHYNYNHVRGIFSHFFKSQIDLMSGECCLILDGTGMDNLTILPNPNPMTNFTTYLKVWEDEEGEAQFKGRSSVINMLPPQVVQQLFGLISFLPWQGCCHEACAYIFFSNKRKCEDRRLKRMVHLPTNKTLFHIYWISIVPKLWAYFRHHTQIHLRFLKPFSIPRWIICWS